MASLNKVHLIGNLTRDPEIKYTQSGTAVCDLGLAVNRIYTSSDGQQKKDTSFIDVNVWGNQAQNCSRYLHKGSLVFVEGRFQMDTWDDKNTGEKRSKIRVVAERIQFLSPRTGGAEPELEDQDFQQQIPQHGASRPQYQNNSRKPPQQQAVADFQNQPNQQQKPVEQVNRQSPLKKTDQAQDANRPPEPPEPPPDAFIENDEIESVPF